jgi:hypothetical protein
VKLRNGVHFDVERRALLTGGAAVLVSNAAQALQAGGVIIDFEAAGGSVRNSGDRNRLAFVAAVARLAAAGGGILRIPAKLFPFSGEAGISASNVTVASRGATFEGPRCRITISRQSNNVIIDGLTMIETSGSRATFLLNSGGSNCRFRNMHLEKRPTAGGYMAYCRETATNNVFDSFSFAGSNGVFVGGTGHRVIGGWAESTIGDDCWVLKAATQPCADIRISGFRARGFTSLISIGSEIGHNPAVRADQPLFVRNVLVENCIAEACSYFAYIKPGGVQGDGGEGHDYRDGLVEDVVLNNCRFEDPTGARFRNGVYVSPGRGATVRRLTINNLTVRARGRAPATQTVGAIYLHALQADPGHRGSTIEDIIVRGLRCADPHAGAANGPGRPGIPIHIPIAIEKQKPDAGRIGRVEIIDAVAEGCARNAVYVGPNVDGPIHIRNSRFNGFAASILASYDREAIRALSPISVQNVVALPSRLAPAGTDPLTVGAEERLLR